MKKATNTQAALKKFEKFLNRYPPIVVQKLFREIVINYMHQNADSGWSESFNQFLRQFLDLMSVFDTAIDPDIPVDF